MAHYIDADELIEALQPALNAEWNKRDHTASRSDMIKDFCTELENWRTADVEPKSEIAKAHEEGYWLGKCEVVKEILSAIDGLLYLHFNGTYSDSDLYGLFAKLKKKYTIE